MTTPSNDWTCTLEVGDRVAMDTEAKPRLATVEAIRHPGGGRAVFDVRWDEDPSYLDRGYFRFVFRKIPQRVLP